MITKFRVEGFKSIESAELDLGAVNVFIGANGSGKSNLLEALAVLAAAAFGRVDEESLVRRGCRPGGFLKPMFRDTPEETATRLTATSGSLEYRVELVSPPPGRLGGWEFKQEVLATEGHKLVDRLSSAVTGKGDPQAGLVALKLAEGEVSDLAAAFLRALAAYSIYTPDSLVMRGLIQDPQPREPVGLSGGRLMESIDEIDADTSLREELANEFLASFEHFKRFFIGARRPHPAGRSEREDVLAFVDKHFRPNPRGGPYILGPNQVNEGALYFLLVAALCLHPAAPGLLAIDNADHGLNPLLAKRLMTVACKWLLDERRPRQVLLTTHDPLVLDGLPLDDQRVRLFTVDRDNRGRTVTKRFQVTSEHRKMASGGWTLSRLWVNGLIGGVPNV